MSIKNIDELIEIHEKLADYCTDRDCENCKCNKTCDYGQLGLPQDLNPYIKTLKRLCEVFIEEPILTDEEHEYLANIIKPFKSKVYWIAKAKRDCGEHIVICLGNEFIFLPFMKIGKYYKGMKADYEYYLSELGL